MTRARSAFCICCALLALLLYAHAVCAAEIGIVEAKTGPGDTHTLSLVVEQATFDWPLTVRRNDSGPTDVAVTVDATTSIGPAARPAEDQHLLSNGQPAAQAALMLSSLGQAVVRLTGSLPVKGDFVGQLGLIVDGKRIPYGVTITRRDPTNPVKVAIVGVGSDNKLAMTSDRAAFEWPIIIRRDDTLEGNADVQVRSSVMTGPSGRLIETRLRKDGKPLPAGLQLAPLAQESLLLTGRADVEGAYSGEITIETGAIRTASSLALTRTRPNFDIKVDPISRLRDTVGDNVALRLRLQNPTGAEQNMTLPIIAQFDRVDASGSAPIDIGVAGYKVDYKLPDGSTASAPLRVAADGALDLTALINGLASPGSYKGAMRFTAADRAPLDVPFELDLRLWGGWAAIAIGLGVILGGVLRYYQQNARPRLLLQRDADSLGSKLGSLMQAEGADLTERERQVITALIQRLSDAKDTLAADGGTDAVQPVLNRVRRKLPLLPTWIQARRRVDGLQPPSIGTAASADLDTVYQTLMDPQADQQLDAANALLQGIDGKIRDAMRAYVTASITETTTAIDAFPANEQIEFNAVRAHLTAAQDAANNQQLPEARATLDRARSGFATTAARLLSAKLAAATPAIGFIAAQWASFVVEMRQLLDRIATEPAPERQVQLWNDANCRYLVEAVRQAKNRIDYLVSANIAGANDRLAEAATHLTNALNALAAGNLVTARTEYDTAIAAANQARPHVVAAGNTLGAAAGADAAAPASGAAVADSIIDSAIGSVLPLPLGQGIDASAVKRTLLILNVAFTVLVLVLAIISGLQLLYVNNATFGWADLLIAFMWGAGLHAVAGQAFQGLTSFAQQFR